MRRVHGGTGTVFYCIISLWALYLAGDIPVVITLRNAVSWILSAATDVLLYQRGRIKLRPAAGVVAVHV